MIVISLYPKPHKLFAFDGLGNFDRDKLGRIIISERVMMPNSFTGEVDRPAATRIWRIENGKPVDKTREYCSEIVRAGNEDFDTQQRVLTRSALKEFSDAPTVPQSDVFGALLSRTMQEVFCGETEKALRDLDYIPQKDRRKAKEELARTIEDTEPEFAKQLQTH